MRKINSSKLILRREPARLVLFILLSALLHLLLLSAQVRQDAAPAVARFGQRIEIGIRSASAFLPMTGKVEEVAVPVPYAAPVQESRSVPLAEPIAANPDRNVAAAAPSAPGPQPAPVPARQTGQLPNTEPPTVPPPERLDAGSLFPSVNAEIIPWQDLPAESGGRPAAAEEPQPAFEGAEKNEQKALPRLALNPLPQYPEIARRRGYEGIVELEVLVLSSGRVGAVDLLVSSGHRSLDLAARNAVRLWQFKPAISLGVPIDSRVVLPIKFVLDESGN
jgi:protein TonB